jgi:glycosyltransferase 2 family protein
VNSKLRNTLRIGIFLLIGGALVVLPFLWFTDAEKAAFFDAVKRADYFWMVVAVGIGALAHLSRAVRWRMLMEPLGHNPRLSTTFAAVMIGYLANYAVPRLGEVSRCGVLNRYDKVPFTESFGTVIVERIFDLLTMVLICVLTLILQFDKLSLAADQFLFSKIRTFGAGILQSPTKLIIVGLILIAGIVGWIFIRRRLKGALGEKVKGFVKGFTNGLSAVRRLRNPWMFFVHSLFIWAMYWMALYVCFFCLPETAHFTLNDALILLIFGTIGVVFTPGGLGAYQGLVAGVLFTLYKFPTEIGTAFGWIAWVPQLFCVLLLGLLSVVMLPLLNRNRNETAS